MNTQQYNKTKKTGLFLVTTVLLLTMCASLALAYSSSPPNGGTNAPGEGNCTGCHSSFPLNSGSGLLSISGLDGEYDAGQSYDLVVSLDDPNAQRWGFEFTIIGDNGQEIGSLTSLDSHTQTSASGSKTYAKQTSIGSQNGTTTGVTWTVRWTAPASGAGDAFFYMAGNAANGNFSTSGDRIYAISEMWTESDVSAVSIPLMAAAKLKPNYPNPFNPRTTIAYELSESQSVMLSIYGLDGRLVRQLESGIRGEGTHEVVWDGLDNHGVAASSGTYFYRLLTNKVDVKRSMILVR
ncbi:MAG: T9SS type A sorting domain-containing protein [bacterium]|nr:T9SS type A sorting domain-containing protein [bacterium]MCP4799979.1 T9SS type A sorting domain-containing protein [bacterium]